MEDFEFALLDGRTCRLSAEYQAKIMQSDLDADWGIKKPEFFENGTMDMYVDNKFERNLSFTHWKTIEEYDNWPYCLNFGSIVIRLPDKQTADRYLEWFSGVIKSGATKEAEEYLRRKEEKDAAERQKREQLQKEREERKSRWEVVKTYRFTKPHGGEEGVDGFSDREYRSTSTGNVIRMIQRDVFDVGTWCYPKRLAGTDTFNMDGWTDEEKDLAEWLSEFGFSSGVRM